MFLVLFAILSAAGAFAAWRQNPMYSLGKTVRFVAVLAQLVGALVLAIRAAIHLTEGQSMGVEMGAMMGVVMVGTAGLIAAIVTMSQPAGTALPKGTKLLRVHRAKVDVWAKRAGWTVLALGILTAVLPGDWRVAPGVVGGLVVLLSCAMLSAGYMSARTMDKWLTEVELRPWVRWTYTAEQWRAWNDVRVAQVQAKPQTFLWKRDWKKFMWPLLAIAVAVFAIYPGEWLWKSLYIVGVGGFLAAVVAWASKGEQVAGETLRKKLNAAAAEASFGDEGLSVDGEFLPWVSAGVYLLGAYRAPGQPPSLAFQFMKVGAGSAAVVLTQAVLLPVGAEADVAKIQKELGVTCPKVDADLV